MFINTSDNSLEPDELLGVKSIFQICLDVALTVSVSKVSITKTRLFKYIQNFTTKN